MVTLMQFNLRNVLGALLPVHPCISCVLEHVDASTRRVEWSCDSVLFFVTGELMWVNEWNTNVLGIHGNSVVERA